jgi:release factor glutamine methyltransferase
VIVEQAAAVLSEAGVPTPDVDAEWIVAHVLGTTRSELVADSHKVVNEAAVWDLVERRARREPLAYVLGEWGFRRLTLRCDARALVPRPEPEQVVERCLELLRDVARPRILDVGTGTGAIALALKDERPDASVVALDASPEAIALARENAQATGRDVELVHADLHDGLPPGPFDLVVSNPPYVRIDELDALEPEVREWEPRAALVDDGQTTVLVSAALQILVPGGHLVLEVHEHGAAGVERLLSDAGYAAVRITRDLARRDRVVEGKKQ